MREKTTRIHRPSIKVRVYHVVRGKGRGTNANERVALRVGRKEYNKRRTYPESSRGNWMCISAGGQKKKDTVKLGRPDPE
jgi:hypothetical protein